MLAAFCLGALLPSCALKGLNDQDDSESAAANAKSLEEALAILDAAIEETAPASGVHSRNFVLCPDDAYDRSPCGTGSSARLACLAADGRLAPGEEIVQASVIGSPYRMSYQPGPNGGVIPSITGQAFVMAESRLIFDPADPFRSGIEIT